MLRRTGFGGGVESVVLEMETRIFLSSFSFAAEIVTLPLKERMLLWELRT